MTGGPGRKIPGPEDRGASTRPSDRCGSLPGFVPPPSRRAPDPPPAASRPILRESRVSECTWARDQRTYSLRIELGGKPAIPWQLVSEPLPFSLPSIPLSVAFTRSTPVGVASVFSNEIHVDSDLTASRSGRSPPLRSDPSVQAPRRARSTGTRETRGRGLRPQRKALRPERKESKGSSRTGCGRSRAARRGSRARCLRRDRARPLSHPSGGAANVGA